ncbi:uncharacterized protein LOC129707381 isoform X1 [Leucoraja erinacea]|uniref:uncharacterized protein LOC129707381 isoform X1 n=1 Tax=Leucoraja erinaceus TaxID=7782 RepID=UPI002455D558|nr:uncharacterized protein LOC129707381 isoform X1 [Leucoraja erinacea]
MLRAFPNQKPWMNHEICIFLKTRSRAFRSGDAEVYKKSRYDLGKAIKKAKRDFCSKLEDVTDVRQLWRGLNAITSYKAKSGCSLNVSEASFPDELNAFYARFDRENTDVPSRAPICRDGISVTVTEADVRRSFRGLNPRKAPGPDGIPGRVFSKSVQTNWLKFLTDIFNLSLLRSEVPTCFKRTSIIPVPKKSKVTWLNDLSTRIG